MPVPAAHTAIPADTAQAQSPAGTPEVFVPRYIHGFERSTPLKETDPLKDLQETIIAIPEGFPSEKIPETPMNDPVIVGLVLIVFLLFAFTFKKGIKYLGEVLRNSLNVKERQNLFNDTTVRETQLRAVLLIMTFISEGFCLFELVSRHIPSLSEMIGIGICCGGVIAFCYYYLQKWIYTGIGRLFTDATHTRKWIDSFVSINSLIGIPLAMSILAMTFIPPLEKIMFVTAVFIYLISRILFIYKGFKIFYRNILDLFYFIVYLCALEITPLFWVYRSSILIYNFVELKIQQL